MGGVAGRVGGGGKRDGLTKFAAVDLAALETLDELGDESFHGVVPLDVGLTGSRTLSRHFAESKLRRSGAGWPLRAGIRRPSALKK